MDVLSRFLAAGHVEIATARRAGADEHRVVIFREQRLQAVDALAADEIDSEIEDVVAFLVDDRIRKAEFRDLRAHHAAGFRIAVEHGAVIAERREIARDGEGGGSAANQRDALAVLFRCRFRQQLLHIILEIGGDALEAADRDRLLLHAAAPAGRLAGAVAGAPEDPGKHIRLPVDHVGVGVTALSDQPDIFGDRRMRRTRPLAVHDLVEVIRIADVS